MLPLLEQLLKATAQEVSPPTELRREIRDLQTEIEETNAVPSPAWKWSWRFGNILKPFVSMAICRSPTVPSAIGAGAGHHYVPRHFGRPWRIAVRVRTVSPVT